MRKLTIRFKYKTKLHRTSVIVDKTDEELNKILVRLSDSESKSNKNSDIALIYSIQNAIVEKLQQHRCTLDNFVFVFKDEKKSLITEITEIKVNVGHFPFSGEYDLTLICNKYIIV